EPQYPLIPHTCVPLLCSLLPAAPPSLLLSPLPPSLSFSLSTCHRRRCIPLAGRRSSTASAAARLSGAEPGVVAPLEVATPTLAQGCDDGLDRGRRRSDRRKCGAARLSASRCAAPSLAHPIVVLLVLALPKQPKAESQASLTMSTPEGFSTLEGEDHHDCPLRQVDLPHLCLLRFRHCPA
ncbi:unnamed protein product, partial [Urochloa humidicola]